jgi:hypothetical protein
MASPLPTSGSVHVASGIIPEILGNDDEVRAAPAAMVAQPDVSFKGATGEGGSITCEQEEHSPAQLDQLETTHSASSDTVSSGCTLPRTDTAVGIRRFAEETGAPRSESVEIDGRAPARSERVAILSEHTRRSPNLDTQIECATEKKSLSARQEGLAKDRDFVGTTIAKAVTAMTSPSNCLHEPSIPAGDAGMFTGPAIDLATSNHVAPAENLNGGAQVAVETILSLADRLSTVDQNIVNLRFSIAGKDLRVRVGLWGNEVRTAFRTESPELRVALANEWQVLTAKETDQVPFRFADPIFSSMDGGSTSANVFADTSSHQESARREPSHASTSLAFNMPSHRALSEQPKEPSAQLSPVRPSSQRLHAFA